MATERRFSYSILETARLLNISRGLVQHHIDSGNLKAFDVGRGKRSIWRITHKALDDFADRLTDQQSSTAIDGPELIERII